MRMCSSRCPRSSPFNITLPCQRAVVVLSCAATGRAKDSLAIIYQHLATSWRREIGRDTLPNPTRPPSGTFNSGLQTTHAHEHALLPSPSTHAQLLTGTGSASYGVRS